MRCEQTKGKDYSRPSAPATGGNGAIALSLRGVTSPWEFGTNSNAWSSLVLAAGFGITAPLQAALAIRVSRATTTAHPETIFVNACYPDVVNPLLRSLDLPIATGIGNVSIIAAALHSTVRHLKTASIHVVAHHFHVASIIKGASFSNGPMIWLDDRKHPIDASTARIIRKVEGARLNQVTSVSALPILLALCTGASVDGHAPGPNGLPGGYPVHCARQVVSIRLPNAFSLEEAIRFNEEASLQDGIRVEHRDRVFFSPKTREHLWRFERNIPESFSAAETLHISHELDILRTRLRQEPPQE